MDTFNRRFNQMIRTNMKPIKILFRAFRYFARKVLKYGIFFYYHLK
jgi:hypothetical protein